MFIRLTPVSFVAFNIVSKPSINVPTLRIFLGIFCRSAYITIYHLKNGLEKSQHRASVQAAFHKKRCVYLKFVSLILEHWGIVD